MEDGEEERLEEAEAPEEGEAPEDGGDTGVFWSLDWLWSTQYLKAGSDAWIVQ